MPWHIKPGKSGGWDIVRTATGEVVGHSASKRNAILSIWHRKKAEGMTPKKHGKRKNMKRNKPPQNHPWRRKNSPTARQLGVADANDHLRDHIAHCRKIRPSNQERLP